MSSSCTPILVGVTSPVSEILLLSKMAKFPFRPMVIKKFNRLESAQKFMQVGIDVKFMHTNFGRRGFSGFGDIAFQNDSINILIFSFVLVLLGSYWYISWWFGAVVS